MKRTQIQLPDPLYREVKRIARLRDWSIAEVVRRALEQMVREFPPDKASGEWRPPPGMDLGAPKIDVRRWRESLADDQEQRR